MLHKLIYRLYNSKAYEILCKYDENQMLQYSKDAKGLTPPQAYQLNLNKNKATSYRFFGWANNLFYSPSENKARTSETSALLYGNGGRSNQISSSIYDILIKN